MTNEKKLPRIIPTRETEHAQLSPDHAGQCHLSYTGRYVVAIEVPEHIHPLIGVEGGALLNNKRVTVLGPHPVTGQTCVRLRSGLWTWVGSDTITPAPKRKRVTLEVDASVDPRHLSLFEHGREPYSGQSVSHRIIAIDGEEVGDA